MKTVLHLKKKKNVLNSNLGDVVAQLRRCGGSIEEMWWLNCGDVVAQFGDVVAQLGDVVAQLVVHQTSGTEVPGSNPASATMILGRCRITVYYCKSQGRGGNLHLGPKKYTKKNYFSSMKGQPLYSQF